MSTRSPSKRYSSSDIPLTTMSNVNDDDAQQFQQIIRDRRGKYLSPHISTLTFLAVSN